MPSVTDALSSVEAALADADADLTTDLGGHHEVTTARLWRGQVLIEWEPDGMAGGSLLRVDRLRRLVTLGAQVTQDGAALRIVAAGRVVAALSDEHAALVMRLGGERKVELRATLRFDAGAYRGGSETYVLIERGQRVPLLRVTADVRPRVTPSGEGSQHTLPGRS